VVTAKQSPSAIAARALSRAASIIRAVPGSSGARLARSEASVSSAARRRAAADIDEILDGDV
jgi:hypothetical protein